MAAAPSGVAPGDLAFITPRAEVAREAMHAFVVTGDTVFVLIDTNSDGRESS